MNGFRVRYRQGSFSLSEYCNTREQALARALSLVDGPGVCHVSVEDARGTPLLQQFQLEAHCTADGAAWGS
jgi:hypothetical protein